MNIDPSGYYRMPLILGPLFDRDNIPRIDYPEVEILALQYQTDFDAIQKLLPDCYRPGKEPNVTILFSSNNGIEWMAGGGYRLAIVQVAARFDGEHDHVEGDYIPIIFENDTWPILGGREDLGVPKLYSDISPVKTLPNGHLRCEASLWGHLLFGIDLAPLAKQNAIVRLAASKRINERFTLAYKYIPSLDGPPDADYPTISKNDTKIEVLWLGKSGEIYFGNAGVEDIARLVPLVDAVKALPVRKLTQTLRLRGSMVLRYDISRRLR
jgi:acetoacetate decarboxylase